MCGNFFGLQHIHLPVRVAGSLAFFTASEADSADVVYPPILNAGSWNSEIFLDLFPRNAFSTLKGFFPSGRSRLQLLHCE